MPPSQSADLHTRFVPGLVTMEIVTLVFPLIQIYNHLQPVRNYRTYTAESGESTNASYAAISEPTTARLTSSSSGKLYTMKDLERCLTNENDRKGLQDFACKREFTGENIMFLTQVHDFRSHWYSLYNGGSDMPPAAKRRMFGAAVIIFAHLVCTDTASVYINIEGRIYKALNAILGDAARAYVSATRGSGSIVSLFGENIVEAADTDEFVETISMTVLSSIRTDGVSLNSSTASSMTADSSTPLTALSSYGGLVTPIETGDNTVIDNFNIARGFDHDIFSDAYKSVKNMVYAQTWQKFNREKDRATLNSSDAV